MTNKKVKGIKGIITIDEIKKHNKIDDCWTIFRGKVFKNNKSEVYNLTPYLEYHPGGIDLLKPAFGRDCTLLFDKYHNFVNGEKILERCYIGVTNYKPEDSYQTIICEEIKEITQNTKSFVFKLKKGINYKYAQNATIILKINSEMTIRTYTLTNVPNKESIEITIKKEKNGQFSKFMHENFEVGSKLLLTDISGDFFPENLDFKKKMLFFSGGNEIYYYYKRDWNNTIHIFFKNNE
jgi:hypothetical protein